MLSRSILKSRRCCLDVHKNLVIRFIAPELRFTKRVAEIRTRFSLRACRELCPLVEIVREYSCMLARDAEDSRVLGGNRVICEAISVHDTALAVVTIKPHNRTLGHDRTVRKRGANGGFNVESPSSMCPNTSSKCPEALAYG